MNKEELEELAQENDKEYIEHLIRHKIIDIRSEAKNLNLNIKKIKQYISEIEILRTLLKK
tara:strand:+ start:318 stop:497 length:180 start_codon:yes stop_codon:yes gene_type:complete